MDYMDTTSVVTASILLTGILLAIAIYCYKKGLDYVGNKFYKISDNLKEDYQVLISRENERRKAIIEEDRERERQMTGANKTLFESLIIDALVKLVTFPNEFDVEMDNPYKYCRELYNKMLNRCEDTKYLEELLCEEMINNIANRLEHNIEAIDYYNAKYLKLEPNYFSVSARKKDGLNRYQVTVRYDGFKFDDRFKDMNFEDYGWDNDKLEASFDIDTYSLIGDADLYFKTGDIHYYIKWLDMQLEYLLTKDTEKRGN